MLKANLKLLLRSKFTFFLLFFIPVLATLVLNIPVNSNEVTAQTKLSVLIIDASKSKLSQTMIERLSSNESLAIECKEDSILSSKDPNTFFTETANRSTIRAFIYIPSDFENRILAGETKNLVTLYDRGNDERLKILNVTLQSILSRFYWFSSASRGDSKIFYDLLGSANMNQTKKEVVMLDPSSNMLTYRTSPEVQTLRYFIAIICAAIVFGANSIVGLFITEKDNLVFKRITLSRTRPITYIGAKLSLGVISLVIQTLVMVIAIKTLTHSSLDISLAQIGLLILGLGLVFLSMSICLGVCLNSIEKINYFAFCMIVLSSMLSGLYFPIEVSPKWMQNIALLFPQRWFIYTADQLTLGNTNALYLYFAVTFGFMVFFISLTLLGYKINNKYSTGV